MAKSSLQRLQESCRVCTANSMAFAGMLRIPECEKQGTIKPSDIVAHPMFLGMPLSREMAAEFSNTAMGNVCHQELLKHPESIQAYGYDPNYVERLEERERAEKMQQQMQDMQQQMRELRGQLDEQRSMYPP